MATSSPTQGQNKRSTDSNLVGKRTRDIVTFLFFVVVCFIFWFVQQLEENFTHEVTMPVVLTDIPQDLVVTTDVASEIKLTVRGKGVDILPYLLFDHPADTLHLSVASYAGLEQSGRSLLIGSQIHKVAKDLLPSQVSILGVNPDTLSFYYNRGTPKRLPVRPFGTIEAQEQYCITGCTFSPESVSVYAPRNVLDTMQAIYTETLLQTELSKTQEVEVHLQNKPGVCARPEVVKMQTRVDILTGQTREVPIVGINFPANKTLRTFPANVRVVYRVPDSKAGDIKADDFTVVISYAELVGNTTNRCRPHINQTPEGVVGAHIEPVEVEYLLENISTEDPEPASKAGKRRQR